MRVVVPLYFTVDIDEDDYEEGDVRRNDLIKAARDRVEGRFSPKINMKRLRHSDLGVVALEWGEAFDEEDEDV